MKPKVLLQNVKQVLDPGSTIQAGLFESKTEISPSFLSSSVPVSRDDIRRAFPRQGQVWHYAAMRIEKGVGIRRRTNNGFLKKVVAGISCFGKTPEDFFSTNVRQMPEWKQLACRFLATTLPAGSSDAFVIYPFKKERPDREVERFVFFHEQNSDPIGNSFIEIFHLWPEREDLEYKAWISPDGVHQYLIDQGTPKG